jgi:hypothetical protein
MRLVTKILLLSLALGLFTAVACASDVPVGFVSYDFIGGGLAEFDITNQTGPNSSPFPDETWPVSNPISLSNLSLTVYFSDGTQFTYGSGYWSLEPDGLSWAGPQLSDGSMITMATLTGTFSPTLFDLNDGTMFNANPNFTATITDSSGDLQNGDFALINATPASGTTPEPGTLVLVGTGALGLLRFRRGKSHLNLRSWFGNRTAIAFALCCLLLLPAASKAFASSVVRLNQWTSPSQGYAGTGQVSITGTGFPTGTIFPGNVTISVWPTTCMSGTPTTTAGLLYRHITGTSGRVQFLIPASLAAGTYPVSISDTVDGITSSNCSMMKVLIHASVSSCVPGASMGVLIQAPTVTAYVPNGAWCCGTTGIQVAQIEPSGGSFTSISTPDVTNSCSSNSTTGETVCVSNGTNIYRITGSTINSTVTSLANNSLGFSGGDCETCGVAIDQVNNLAYMQIGISGSPSGGGIETLNLGTGAQSAFPTFYEPSEDIQVDPGRNWLLSPSEPNATYDLINTSSSPYKEYGMPVSGVSGEFDSAAEDCTTGIALSTEEGSTSLFITDPTQAAFVGGSPGSWTAPGQNVNFPEFGLMGAGTSGIAVAPGSHLAIVTGEFGSNQVGVVTLPSTSGSGTPNFGDYVSANLPNTPDGVGFSLGFDPHTITAYQSPGGGFFGLAADWARGSPSYVAVVDMPGLLSAPRCNPAPGHQCVFGMHEVDPSYDLVAHGIVRYVQVH